MEYRVNTPCGVVQGKTGSVAGTAAYLGIRFANAGRWEYPRVVEHWEGVYDATRFGACCWQERAFAAPDFTQFYEKEFRVGREYRYDEDCLMLNVFAPDTAKPGDKLPVIVFIHGGNYVTGSANENNFDMPVWPARGVIGVTIQYRVGPWGFVCLPELKEEAGFTGNYGLYDQIAALQWVQRNIPAFGGDAGNVTLMGQSAGAMSVQQLCLSPLSQGLFHRAVMCSGGGVHKALDVKPSEEAYPFWRRVMELAGCKTLAEFRAVSPETLHTCWQKAQKACRGGNGFPNLDGRLVVGTGTELLAAGKQMQIPYLIGTTSEDVMPPILYSVSAAWASAQRIPSYLWFFQRKLPGDRKGAWHSSDLWYWFGSLKKCWRPWEPQDNALSEQMIAYLLQFARTGDPNAPGLPRWEPANHPKPEALCLGRGEAYMGRPSMLRLTLNFFKQV